MVQRYEWSGTPFKARAEPCRGAFTGCRLCRRPLQNSMFGCYDDLSGAKKYSCNLLFYWLMLPLFTGMIILYTLEDSNLTACRIGLQNASAIGAEIEKSQFQHPSKRHSGLNRSRRGWSGTGAGHWQCSVLRLFSCCHCSQVCCVHTERQ